MIEERSIVINGQEIPGYLITNTGIVYSLKKKSRNARGKLTYINGSEKDKKELQIFRWTKTKPHVCVTLHVPLEKITDQYYIDSHIKQGKKAKNHSKKYFVHQLVMDTFKPIDKYPPERLKKHWDNLPEEVKSWIRETAVINHIDHDPTNNSLDNLEWVTPKENSRKATKFYGGKLDRSCIYIKENRGKENVVETVKVLEKFYESV